MNEHIKKQGWQQMQAVLDKEMPSRQNHNKPIGWILLAMLLVGFGLGFTVRDIFKSGETGKPSETGDQPLVKTNNQVHQKTHLSSTLLSDPYDYQAHESNHVKKQYLDKKPLTMRAKVKEYQNLNLVNVAMAKVALEHVASTPKDRENSFPDMDRQSVMPLTICPSIEIQELQQRLDIKLAEPVNRRPYPWSTFQKLSLEAGMHWQNPTSRSIGLHYQWAWQKNQSYIFASIGYRFLKYEISASYDTLAYSWVNSPNMQNENLQTQHPFDLDKVHQIIPGVGFGYNFGKSWFGEVSLRFPMEISGLNVSHDLASADQETTGSEFNGPNIPSSKDHNRWDVQPSVTIGKNFSEHVSAQLGASLGFRPLNTFPLQDKSDLYFNQWTAGLSYRF